MATNLNIDILKRVQHEISYSMDDWKIIHTKDQAMVGTIDGMEVCERMIEFISLKPSKKRRWKR